MYAQLKWSPDSLRDDAYAANAALLSVSRNIGDAQAQAYAIFTKLMTDCPEVESTNYETCNT